MHILPAFGLSLSTVSTSLLCILFPHAHAPLCQSGKGTHAMVLKLPESHVLFNKTGRILGYFTLQYVPKQKHKETHAVGFTAVSSVFGRQRFHFNLRLSDFRFKGFRHSWNSLSEIGLWLEIVFSLH